MSYVRLTIVVVLYMVVVVLTVGCEHGAPMQTVMVEPRLSSIQANIFDQRCAQSGCHVGSGAPLGLDLSSKSFADLVNVPSAEAPSIDRVEPFDPDRSYLVMKIEGVAGIVGGRMPLNQDRLSDDEINAIRDWISSGAQNE